MTGLSRAALAALLAWTAPAALLVPVAPAVGGEARLWTLGGASRVAVTSLKEARFKSVIRQQHDFSCGSAALATLLSFHYRRPTTEETVFRAMFAVGDQKAIQRHGFSLADMQRYLASLGLRSDGFRVSLDKLAEIGIPAITLINFKGYNHFVVVKGLRDGQVLVGDPALGLKAIPRAEFDSMWQKVMFVVRDDIPVGRENFNGDPEWAVQRKAPFGTALSRRGLATFSVALPGLFEF